MGKASRRVTLQMAAALQQAVAMYFLLHEHARGVTDLTDDQLAAVVEGVCDEARVVLEEARRVGLLAPTPRGGRVRVHTGSYVREPHMTVQ